MKVTFPHMSPVLVYKKFVELLGHEVIVPPLPTQKTIDLGVKYSPEFACFPLKVILGSYIESIEKGAEVIITSGGRGPCRAGFYGELHTRILKNLGYNVEVIVFDSIFSQFREFLHNASKLKGKNSLFSVYLYTKIVLQLAKSLDNVEKKMQKIRAHEANFGDCMRLWDKVLEEFDKANTIKDIISVENNAIKDFDNVASVTFSDIDSLKVGVVGEIYVVMESSVNMEMEKLLGKYGVETERSQYLSEWLEFNLKPKRFRKNNKVEKILEKGREFIEINIGGHAQETVGFIKDFKDRGFDGIIHLMPFGCLPELVTQSLVPNISELLDIPVLTIPIDEQTGKSNNLTRIEAFVDLLKNKKALKTFAK
jgi:predicted nucleotide-binding protein (sugar kinase/HSP70/actin superfamily)